MRAELGRVCSETTAPTRFSASTTRSNRGCSGTGSQSYREVLTKAMRRLGAPAGEEPGLAESLPDWGSIPGRAGCAGGGAAPRVEARGPLEHRRRLHRRLSGADRRPFVKVVVARRSARTNQRTRDWEEFYARARAPRDFARPRCRFALPRYPPGNGSSFLSVSINRTR